MCQNEGLDILWAAGGLWRPLNRSGVGKELG